VCDCTGIIGIFQHFVAVKSSSIITFHLPGVLSIFLYIQMKQRHLAIAVICISGDRHYSKFTQLTCASIQSHDVEIIQSPHQINMDKNVIIIGNYNTYNYQTHGEYVTSLTFFCRLQTFEQISCRNTTTLERLSRKKILQTLLTGELISPSHTVSQGFHSDCFAWFSAGIVLRSIGIWQVQVEPATCVLTFHFIMALCGCI